MLQLYFLVNKLISVECHFVRCEPKKKETHIAFSRFLVCLEVQIFVLSLTDRVLLFVFLIFDRTVMNNGGQFGLQMTI